MATGTTRRTASNTIAGKALLWPQPGDPDTLSADQHAMAQALENDVEGGQGKLSERPAAKLRGRLYYVTEGSEMGLWWDTGTAWVLASDKPLNLIESAISVTANNAERVKATANKITITSPAATLDTTFGVLANGNEVKVKLASGEVYIWGEKTKEFRILGQQNVTLQADGTNWYVIASQLAPERVQYNTDLTLAPGEIAESSATISGKLPAAAGNGGMRLSAFNGYGGTTFALKCEHGEGIFGDFVSGSSQIILQALQHVELVSDAVNWIIVAGEPENPGEYVYQGTLNPYPEEHTPNPSRPVFVLLKGSKGGGEYSVILPGGGPEVPEFVGASSFICPAGKKWYWKKAGGGGSPAEECQVWYLTL